VQPIERPGSYGAPDVPVVIFWPSHGGRRAFLVRTSSSSSSNACAANDGRDELDRQLPSLRTPQRLERRSANYKNRALQQRRKARVTCHPKGDVATRLSLFYRRLWSRTPCVALASPRPAPRLSGLALSRNQTGVSRSEHLTIRLNGAAERKNERKTVKNRKINLKEKVNEKADKWKRKKMADSRLH